MKAFSMIETNVTAHPTVAEAKQAVAAAGDCDPRLAITSEAELAASSLGMGQLVDIWNGFAGVVPFDDLQPVRKFTDRKTAAARIWKAIQRLEAPTVPQGAHVAPKRTKAAKQATAAEGAPTAREGSKKAIVLEFLRRPEGATLATIQSATGWQAHSVRGFISGALGKKMGLTVTRLKRDDGASVYFLTE